MHAYLSSTCDAMNIFLDALSPSVCKAALYHHHHYYHLFASNYVYSTWRRKIDKWLTHPLPSSSSSYLPRIGYRVKIALYVILVLHTHRYSFHFILLSMLLWLFDFLITCQRVVVVPFEKEYKLVSKVKTLLLLLLLLLLLSAAIRRLQSRNVVFMCMTATVVDDRQ